MKFHSNCASWKDEIVLRQHLFLFFKPTTCRMMWTFASSSTRTCSKTRPRSSCDCRIIAASGKCPSRIASGPWRRTLSRGHRWPGTPWRSSGNRKNSPKMRLERWTRFCWDLSCQLWANSGSSFKIVSSDLFLHDKNKFLRDHLTQYEAVSVQRSAFLNV